MWKLLKNTAKKMGIEPSKGMLEGHLTPCQVKGEKSASASCKEKLKVRKFGDKGVIINEP
ncbi:MAG TPA: hypothetical protein VIO11_08335 [Candidatus Methanoperedens sp.]